MLYYIEERKKNSEKNDLPHMKKSHIDSINAFQVPSISQLYPYLDTYYQNWSTHV